jgi:hypothetical protein
MRLHFDRHCHALRPSGRMAAVFTSPQPFSSRVASSEDAPTETDLRGDAGIFAAPADDAVPRGAERRFAVALHGFDRGPSDQSLPSSLMCRSDPAHAEQPAVAGMRDSPD